MEVQKVYTRVCVGVLFDAARAPTCRRDCLLVSKAPTRRRPTAVVSSFRATERSYQVTALRPGPQSAAPHRRAEAKRRAGARGGEWCEQTLQQACSQAYPGSAMCVQNFDDSLNSAIRITYRISLRSSSLREPRYPLLKVVSHWYECGGIRVSS